MKVSLTLAVLSVCCLMRADTLTWKGGAGDDRWSVDANWASDGSHAHPQAGDDVVLAPTLGETAIANDLEGLSLNRLTVSCGNLSLGGNALEITGGMTVAASELQMSMPLVWNATDPFEQTSGHVWFLGGFALSGSSDFVKTGPGSLHLACDNGAFEGKIVSRAGNFESYTASGLGVAGFEFDSCNQTYTLTLDFSGTVIAPCTFKNGNSGSFVFQNGCEISFAAAVVCVGSVRLNANGVVHFAGGLSEDVTAPSDIILNGQIHIGGDDDAGDLAGQVVYSDFGEVHLGARVDNCRGFDVGKGGLVCERANVFHDTDNFVRIGFGYSESAYVDYFDLNGYDQSIQCLLWRGPENEAVMREVRTSSPATLTIAGCGDVFNGHLNGALTLDVNPIWGGTFTLTGGRSDMSGGLVCRRGGITVASDVTMPNLSSVIVEAGTVTLNAPVGGDRLEVTVAGEGGLSLGEDVEIRAFRARFGSSWLAAGTYREGDVPGLSGAGTLVVLDDGPVVYEGTSVWTGAVDHDIAKSANWQNGKAPDLTRGAWAMSFSAGSSEAFLSDAAKTWGLVFSAQGDFLLNGASTAALVLGEGGIDASNPLQEGAVTYGLEVPLGIRRGTDVVEWKVGARTTLALHGSVFSESFLPGIRTVGGGDVVFTGDNADWTTSYEQRGGTLRFVGERAAGRVTPEREITFVGPCGQLTGDFLRFEGIVSNGVRLRLAGSINNISGTDEETMFTQAGEVECIAHPDNADEYVTFRHPTPFTYRGGITSTNSPAHIYMLIPGSARHVYIEDRPIVTEKNVYQDSDGWLHLNVSGNRANALVTYNAHTSCGATNALFNYCLLGPAGWAGASQIDLGGCDQSVLVVEGCRTDSASEHEITSERPAMLRFSLDYSLENYLKFTGFAGLRYAANSPSAMMTLKYESTTKGTLNVASGVLAIAPGAGWTAVSNVVLESTGTIRILPGASMTAFGPAEGVSGAALRRTGGTLEVPAGETVTVRTLSVSGTAEKPDYLPRGVYRGIGGGQDPAHTLDWLEGGGALRVLRQPGSGSLLLVR